MGIHISEHTDVFQVPYGSPNNDGTPEASFVDVKAHPEWIAVLPSCVGWPETQSLLQVINAPESPMMSLAADQGFTTTNPPNPRSVLTSFVIICLAEPSADDKPTLRHFAEFLKSRMDELLQEASNALKQRLDVQIRLELQPTRFHQHEVDGWSLMILTATLANEKREARHMWGIVLQALETAWQAYQEER